MLPRLLASFGLLPFLLTLGLAQSPDDGAEAPPRLTPENVAAWKRHILPTEEESAFEKIDWIAGFAEGLRAAREKDRLLLFYAMNGHPLGCT